MKRLRWMLIALCVHGSVNAIDTAGLQQLYDRLDSAIDSADVFLQKKTTTIETLTGQLATSATTIDSFVTARRIYEEYVPFINDSAITYLYMCMDLATRMDRADLHMKTHLALADQLTESGFYHEALTHYAQTDRAALPPELLPDYYYGLGRLYTEMGYYSHDPRLRDDYYAKGMPLIDSLLATHDSTSVRYLQQLAIGLTGQGRYDEALSVCTRWEQLCAPESRSWATMAFYRSIVYSQQGHRDEARRWLALSALADVHGAIMDQGALWSLAETFISEEQNLDRAHRYIDFSWQCLSRFSTHMRSWLVAPIVVRINNEYKEQLSAANSQMRWVLALISLLAAGLLAALFYVAKKRRQLAAARQHLKTVNDDLSATNEQMRLAMAHLNDSNRVKDEYLAKFLNICSAYIDKLDNYRIMVNRKLKAKQYNDLLRVTASEQLKEDELKELFDNFDNVFLYLFPTFVDDFNALLRPEERIQLRSGMRLNTDLRIFALIRLGIDESSRIAEFLRYSPNSIYAYRNRTKNKAAGNRDDFERQVKEIGIDRGRRPPG